MSKEELISIVEETLKKDGINEDLSELQLYYDGPAEEKYTSQGTEVFSCPVWYGGLERITLAIYDLGKKICISIRLFLSKNTIDKDLFYILPT